MWHMSVLYNKLSVLCIFFILVWLLSELHDHEFKILKNLTFDISREGLLSESHYGNLLRKAIGFV